MLLSIQALLSAPNPDDPLANDVAEAWKTNEHRAIQTGIDFSVLICLFYVTYHFFLAKEWTKLYAK